MSENKDIPSPYMQEGWQGESKDNRTLDELFEEYSKLKEKMHDAAVREHKEFFVVGAIMFEGVRGKGRKVEGSVYCPDAFMLPSIASFIVKGGNPSKARIMSRISRILIDMKRVMDVVTRGENSKDDNIDIIDLRKD